jgi:hypothetical protein
MIGNIEIPHYWDAGNLPAWDGGGNMHERLPDCLVAGRAAFRIKPINGRIT